MQLNYLRSCFMEEISSLYFDLGIYIPVIIISVHYVEPVYSCYSTCFITVVARNFEIDGPFLVPLQFL